MVRDGRSKPSLALDDEPRIVALLATAYEQPVGPQVLAKIRLANFGTRVKRRERAALRTRCSRGRAADSAKSAAFIRHRST